MIRKIFMGIITGLLLLVGAFILYCARYTVRWKLGSNHYKKAVLATAPGPGWQHVEFDRWSRGSGPAMIEYLVHEPRDALQETDTESTPTVLPAGWNSNESCRVVRIWRMEPQWFLVTFLPGTSWDNCPYG